MNPTTCVNCGGPISNTAFECPRCGAAGPNMPGSPRRGLTRGRWTVLCLVVFIAAALFPPMHQQGQFSVDGRTTVIDHKVWPAWIGMANGRPDIGYARNGQSETVIWNISREINRPVWYGVLWFVAVAWFAGMFRSPRRVARYQQVVVARPAPEQAPIGRAEDRSVQPPPRRAAPPYPGTGIATGAPLPFDPQKRKVPPPGGRYR